MPFILLGLVILAGIAYGAVRLYGVVAAHFGTLAAVAAIVACGLGVAGLAADAVRRYRAVHGVRRDGKRLVRVAGEWGELALDADRKMGALRVDGREVRFVFSDVTSARPMSEGGRWSLAMTLAHHAQAEWCVPMADRAMARRWTKIFRLASAHRL
ncbi:hypothetical protein HUS70_07075 [Pandoraea nosoerga]|uniref:Membrane protein n=1 Tax=Pandoraea nosoerga TaxID=2508296 RepID=A0A5E4TM15_9BURK|nr:hypothetical protein [Pandoraea nosoerga]MBN4665501.1 hypothetical protein [Pandoraea nosoerga]MBN4675026.1 hypothetical protein [Pandoraea nosoerga]MBN4680342.1 hypothetical protein [Pandoraea nosoerga]MBN4744425.1 hypothetical protein [Pandoraea nosoerga]VVD87558.1 membrane protein [Pandoraea nosoerga]